jgi:hypothetical protein
MSTTEKAYSKMNNAGDKHNLDSEVRERAKRRGDAVESLLKAAGAVREQESTPSLTLFGELQPQFHTGDKVQVRVEDGSWRGGLRAVSGIEEIEHKAGAPQKVVRVTWEDEWQAAEREGREPVGAPWPYEQVEFLEPSWTSNAGSDTPQLANVFIGYGSNDAEEAWKLAHALISVGLKVWLDPWERGVGDSILERMDDGLEGATYLLLSHSLEREISTRALRKWLVTLDNQLNARGVKILPVRLTAGDPQAIVADTKYVDFTSDWAKGMTELLRALR